MKKLILLLSLMLISLDLMAESVDKLCFSKSGKSSYHMNLDIKSLNGVLDYEFMGQKITYNMTKIKHDNSSFRGVAIFLSSKTGETKGNSFVFSYDSNNNIFTENNMTYQCH